MLPILQIGPLALPLPALSIILAFWVGLSITEKLSPSRGLSAETMYNLAFTGLLTGLLGARLGYVFLYPKAFIQSPLSFFSLNPGLLDTSTGVVFMLLGVLIFGQLAKLPLLKTLDTLTPFLAILSIGLAISHIASGEAFGSITSLPWGIDLWGARRHPTQIYELFSSILILVVISIKFEEKSNHGTQFFLFWALMAADRLFFEAFRGDSLTIAGGLRSVQIIAWIVLFLALFILDKIQPKLKKNKREQDGQNSDQRPKS